MDLLADSREVIRNDVSVWHCFVRMYFPRLYFLKICFFTPNRVCCYFSSSPRATLPFRKLWHLKMHLSVSWISSQRRAAATEVKGVSGVRFTDTCCSLNADGSALCCRYCGGGLFAAVAQPAEEQQLQSELLQGGLLRAEDEAVVRGRRRQLGLVCAKSHQPAPHAAGKRNLAAEAKTFSFKQHSIGCCSPELSAVLSVGASHGVSGEFPRSYSQLSEIHVSVWPAAAALHHPHGHWCACWHPHRGKLVVDCEGSHEAVRPDLTPGSRPSTLYRRLSGARKSTRTTLLLSTLPQIRHGRTHTHTHIPRPNRY